MPRKGYAYPVDDQWRARVEARMAERKLNRAALARAANCPRSLVTELLITDDQARRDPKKHQRNHTTYLPEIHTALLWPLPQPALAPGAVPELSYIYERLDTTGRESVLEAARKELDRILGEAPRRSSKKA